MEINDDADLDTTQVTHVRGCTYEAETGKDVCSHDQWKKSVEEDDAILREAKRKHPELN